MTCFTCGHRLQCSYKSVVAMTLLTTNNPINLYRYRTELNWYQFVISSLQSPASTTSVPNFLSRLRSESRVKHNQAAYQNIQIRVSDCQIVTCFRNKINNQSLYTAQLIDCQIEHSKTIPTVQTHQFAHFREDCTFFFPSPSRMHVLQNQANDGKQLQVI